MSTMQQGEMESGQLARTWSRLVGHGQRGESDEGRPLRRPAPPRPDARVGDGRSAGTQGGRRRRRSLGRAGGRQASKDDHVADRSEGEDGRDDDAVDVVANHVVVVGTSCVDGAWTGVVDVHSVEVLVLRRPVAAVTSCLYNKLENVSSHTDIHTCAGSAFDNRVILTFDLFTSGSVHADCMDFIETGVDSSSRLPFRARTHSYRQTN